MGAPRPAHVEVPVETRIGDVVVRGRIDAVFRDADGGWDLVDWKTGRRPSAAQLKVKAVQLAVYRLAWARLKGSHWRTSGRLFYYVADNQVVRPHDLGSADKLEEIARRRWGGHRRRGESRRNQPIGTPSRKKSAGRNAPAGTCRKPGP